MNDTHMYICQFTPKVLTGSYNKHLHHGKPLISISWLFYSSCCPIQIQYPEPQAVEIDPDVLWQQLQEVINVSCIFICCSLIENS